ncbi:DUF4365 domain-containing protein [Nocardia sp. NPDC127606]|uniref:tetratricopeptide repeat protein n=1 Tax=Nocardia sp. NPDC127606 TaxID=3345406 RepID=UPI00364192C1
MVEMPQRPRPHVLEDEARAAFGAVILPLGWVVRPVDSKDYGIDDEVEIFHAGQATGLKFYVQSKGTDEPEPTVTMRLGLAHQNYFHSLDLPVLLARYHSTTKRTYVQWFHRFDPYPRTVSQTIRFMPDAELTPLSAAELRTEVQALRVWNRPTMRWPVRLRVTATGAHTARDLELAVHEAIGTNSVLALTKQPGPPEQPTLEATVGSDTVRVAATTASHTTDGPPGWTDTESRAVVAWRIVLGAALVLGNIGLGDKAAPLLEAFLCEAPVNADLAEKSGTYFSHANRADCALRVAQHWLDRASTADELAPAILTLHSACAGVGRAETGQLIAAGAMLKDIAEKSLTLKSGRREMVAASAFLAAARCHFHKTGDWKTADLCFTHAVKLDPSIARQSETLAEVAGAAHEAGDYIRAAQVYASAIELCPDDTRLLARRADSLLQQGRLTDAASLFGQYFERMTEDPEAIWCLKSEVIGFLLRTGMTDGIRDPDAADRVLADRGGSETPHQTRRRCLRAAGHDPLHRAAWSELGLYDLHVDDPGRAAAPLTVAALADRRPEPWALAVAAAVRGGFEMLATCLAVVGVYDFGEDFHLELRALVAQSSDQNLIVEFVERVDQDHGWVRRGGDRDE